MTRVNRRFSGGTLARREAIAFYAFIGPWIVGMLVFTLYPLGASLYYSLTDFNGAQMTFIGLDNYRRMFSEPMFYSGPQNSDSRIASNQVE